MSDNRVLWCFLSSPPARSVHSFSRHAIAHARDILCALALALALTPPAAVFGCKGWSIARAWLFGSSSGATPRVVGFGRSASAHSFLRRLASSGVCVFDARPVKQATEPSAPRARSRRGQRRKLVEVVQSFARYRYICSKFSVWLSRPELIGYYIWPENIESEQLFYSNPCCHVLPQQLSIRKTRSGRPEHFSI